MKPSPLIYHRPESLAEATALLSEYGDESKIIAGGQSLMPMLAFRLVAPRHLIDIGWVAELAGYQLDDRELCVRARVSQRDLERAPDVGFAFPVLHEAIANVAHVQIRNRGTVCGSLAHADPAAEMPATMVALDATMMAHSANGRRAIPAAEFFQFHLTSVLEPEEVLTEVRIPRQPAVGAFLEISRRKGDFALVGAAVVAQFEGEQVSSCRIVCSGVGPVPFRAVAAEQAVLDTALGDDVVMDARWSAGEGMDPADDLHASGDYRRQVAGVLVRRCLLKIRKERGAAHA
jgi:carbon-monoxide dehydrogenase medium subunit